jgi:hypothetical protein
MWFNRKHLWGFLAVLLGTGVAAAEGIPARITVLVNDSAGVPADVLKQAEQEAGKIFRPAGVEIAWLNCGEESVIEGGMCREVPGANRFVLHIVPNGKTSTDLVFGVAFLGEDGRGKYCNVFFDRIREAHRDLGTSTSQLLGTVAAHELGHLLLGSHAHSRWGIMEPVWKGEALRQAGMGVFLFTAEQGKAMRERIESEGMVLVGWKVKNSVQRAVVSGQ